MHVLIYMFKHLLLKPVCYTPSTNSSVYSYWVKESTVTKSICLYHFFHSSGTLAILHCYRIRVTVVKDHLYSVCASVVHTHVCALRPEEDVRGPGLRSPSYSVFNFHF